MRWRLDRYLLIHHLYLKSENVTKAFLIGFPKYYFSYQCEAISSSLNSELNETKL